MKFTNSQLSLSTNSNFILFDYNDLKILLFISIPNYLTLIYFSWKKFFKYFFKYWNSQILSFPFRRTLQFFVNIGIFHFFYSTLLSLLEWMKTLVERSSQISSPRFLTRYCYTSEFSNRSMVRVSDSPVLPVNLSREKWKRKLFKF